MHSRSRSQTCSSKPCRNYVEITDQFESSFAVVRLKLYVVPFHPLPSQQIEALLHLVLCTVLIVSVTNPIDVRFSQP